MLKLYNAGILTGSDAAGSFKPTSTIQRSEVATIVTRMADKSLRKTFTLSAAPSAPSVSASTKKFDGMLTADDLQGVWYAHQHRLQLPVRQRGGVDLQRRSIYLCCPPSEERHLLLSHRHLYHDLRPL